MHKDADVLILGGGVIGLACAHYLQAEGRSVRVIDQGKVGAATSWGNCGTLTPSHAAPLAAPGMVGQALRWMLRPDAPLYIRPRWDPALARWLARMAGRCNARDWRETGLAKGALLNFSPALERGDGPLVGQDGGVLTSRRLAWSRPGQGRLAEMLAGAGRGPRVRPGPGLRFRSGRPALRVPHPERAGAARTRTAPAGRT